MSEREAVTVSEILKRNLYCSFYRPRCLERLRRRQRFTYTRFSKIDAAPAGKIPIFGEGFGRIGSLKQGAATGSLTAEIRKDLADARDTILTRAKAAGTEWALLQDAGIPRTAGEDRAAGRQTLLVKSEPSKTQGGTARKGCAALYGCFACRT